jgi:ribonuclease R
MLLLRAMKQASYAVRNLGHFGLASKAYLHFTSPIRRYPDLVVHRFVHRAIQGLAIDRSEKAQGELEDAALAASTAERRSMEVEREIADLYRATLMQDKVGERYEGMVSGLVGSGAFVALDAPYVDVLVKLEDLGGDGYELDDEGLKIVAASSGDVVMLGDRMTVEIVDVQIMRRTVYGRRIRQAGEYERAKRRDRKAPREEKPQGRPARRDKHGKKARAARAFKASVRKGAKIGKKKRGR